MPIESWLTEGEEVLAQAGHFYATNKRLIRYHRTPWPGEEWDDIAYGHLSSISLLRCPRRGLVWSGVVVLVLVLSTLLTLAIMVPLLKSLSSLIGTAIELDMGPFILPLFMGIALGIVLILVGSLVPTAYFQFRAPGLTGAAEARFRLGKVRQQATRDLVRTVRQHL